MQIAMKALALLIGSSVAGSVALFFLLYVKHNEEIALAKSISLMDVKMHTLREVLGEYQVDLVKLQDELDMANKELEILGSEVKKMESESKPKQTEADVCQGEKKMTTDEIAAIEVEINTSVDRFTKDKARWAEEVTALKKQLEQTSNVCKFVDKTSGEGMKLCGITPSSKPSEPKSVNSQ